jgi:acyl dehydratase
MIPTRAKLTVGTEGPEFVDDALTLTDFVRYQGASGDMNPIHHDPDFARGAGFEMPFAVGMRQAGVLATWATDWLGAANVRRFKVQWQEQAWPGDVLTYRGAIVAEREEGGQRFLDLEMTVTRQTGGVHLKGWASFIAPSDSD